MTLWQFLGEGVNYLIWALLYMSGALALMTLAIVGAFCVSMFVGYLWVKGVKFIDSWDDYND